MAMVDAVLAASGTEPLNDLLFEDAVGACANNDDDNSNSFFLPGMLFGLNVFFGSLC